MFILREIRDFLVQEKFYTALLLIFLAFYGYVAIMNQHSDRHERMTEQSQLKIRLMEERVMQEKELDFVDVLFSVSRDPLITYLVIAAHVLILILGLFGIGALVYYAGSKLMGRELIDAACPSFSASWFIRDATKCVILVLFVSLVADFSLAIVNSYLLGGRASNFLVLVHTSLVDLFAVGVILYFVLVKYRGTWLEIGFGKLKVARDFVLGVVGYFAFLPILIVCIIVLVQIAQRLHYEPPPHELIQIFLNEKMSPWMVTYSLVLACVFGPIVEELFFRGFCYPAFKKRWGSAWAMILTSFFFAVIHRSLFAFLPIFLLGLALAYIYEKRRTLLPAIALHMAHNSVFIFYFFVAKKLFLPETG